MPTRLAGALCLTSLVAGTAACASHAPPRPAAAPAVISAPRTSSLAADLDAIFGAPELARALVAVRFESLRTGRVLYTRNAGKLVVPASNLKLVTIAAAAERLGWDYRFETRLDATGTVSGGVLHGDLVVTGSGDPSIAAKDLRGAPLFDEWADAVGAAGIRHVDGRLVGDDHAFDQEPLGAGWAWDYLAAGYAAPSGALSYNENVAVVRITPGGTAGLPARIQLGPPGHGLHLHDRVVTAAAGTTPSVTLGRLPGSSELTITGQVPAGGAPLIRTAAVDRPTRFFLEALRLALAERGIGVAQGAWDIDDLATPPAAAGRRPIARHLSEPLSSLAGYAMKVSQNFYGETLLKAQGRAVAGVGSAETGRRAVRQTLDGWGLPDDSLVMYDGSGLSRYDYVTADLLVGVLRHLWNDPRLRGPFVAALPVAGHDGTLVSRMRGGPLDRRVQAKTGTMANVRALSGYLEANDGQKIVFAMIANNFTVPSAAVDGAMESALERVARAGDSAGRAIVPHVREDAPGVRATPALTSPATATSGTR